MRFDVRLRICMRVYGCVTVPPLNKTKGDGQQYASRRLLGSVIIGPIFGLIN